MPPYPASMSERVAAPDPAIPQPQGGREVPRRGSDDGGDPPSSGRNAAGRDAEAREPTVDTQAWPDASVLVPGPLQGAAGHHRDRVPEVLRGGAYGVGGGGRRSH